MAALRIADFAYNRRPIIGNQQSAGAGLLESTEPQQSMNRRSILTKTGKGLMEATGKTSDLARDLRNILKEIDGKVSVSELMRTFSKMTEPELLEALKSMESEGYLREFVGKQDEAPRPSIPRTPTAPSSADSGEDLDFTAFTPAKPSARTSEDAKLHAQAQDIARQAQATRAREEAAAKAKAELAARARAEAEHKARLSTRAGLSTQSDALDQARREAEERQRREAEDKARREAVARAVIEAEQAGKREAEERVRREIEERIRRENEEGARREAETRVHREAEEKVRRDAEERMRREADERTRKEVEERMLREEVERRRREEYEQAELRTRIEAEARAKVEAEMRARRESEERARREEEERPRREEELRRRAEEEVRERRETEDSEALERSLREQEENARREAEYREREEQERREEEGRARRESEEEAQRAEEEEKRAREDEEEKRAKEEEKQAREEEKAQAKAAKAAKAAKKARKAVKAKERAGEEAWRGDDEARDSNEASLSARELWAKRRPGSLAKQFAVMLLLTLIVAVAALPFVPLESGPYEKAAQAWLGVPVKIGTVNLTLLPIPQLKFEKVVIGKEHPMRAAVIKAAPVLTSLLEDAISLKSLELENVIFPREFLPVLLQDKGGRRSLGVQRVSAKGLKLDIPELNLPALEVSASLSSDGALQSVAFSNAERRLSVKLQPQGGRAGIEISADSFPLPTGADLTLSEFFAKGTVTRGELALSEAEARAFGGRVLGNARIRWSNGWSMEGEFVVRQMEAGKIAAPLLAGGTLEGKGVYSMKGLLPERMILN